MRPGCRSAATLLPRTDDAQGARQRRIGKGGKILPNQTLQPRKAAGIGQWGKNNLRPRDGDPGRGPGPPARRQRHKPQTKNCEQKTHRTTA